MFVFSVCRLVSRRCHHISPLPSPLSAHALLCQLRLLSSTRLLAALPVEPSASESRPALCLAPLADFSGLPPAAIMVTGSRLPIVWALGGEISPDHVCLFLTAPSRITPGFSGANTLTRPLRLGASPCYAGWPSTGRLIHGFVFLRLGHLSQTLRTPPHGDALSFLTTPPKSDRRRPDLHWLDSHTARRT